MKHPWLPYTVVGVLSVGVGVAIAGLPSNTPTDAVTVSSSVDPPTTPTTPATTTTTTTAAPTTTEPVTTETAVDTTEVVTTEVALGERDQVVVVAANGAQIGGAATRMATGLEATGYVDVGTFDGTEKFDYTTVYYADGFEPAAVRMAEDLALHPDFIAPLASAPAVPGLPADAELLVYVGVDRAT